MGYRPEDVDRMSVWQFNAAAIGWSKQYETGMSEGEKDEIWQWLQSKDDVPAAHRRH